MNSIHLLDFYKSKKYTRMRKAHECGVYKIRKAPSEQEEAGFSNQKAVKVCYAVFYTNKPNFVT